MRRTEYVLVGTIHRVMHHVTLRSFVAKPLWRVVLGAASQSQFYKDADVFRCACHHFVAVVIRVSIEYKLFWFALLYFVFVCVCCVFVF